MKTLIRFVRLAAVLGGAVALTACQTVKLPAPSPSPANVEKLRAASLTPVNTGTFVLAPGRDKAMDTAQGGLRSNSIEPQGGSFALQLRDELATELRAAGLLDPNAKTVIEGQLTDSKLDAAIGTGTGRLAARFVVKRDGKQVFDKELFAEASWESSFIGGIAIPAAVQQYGALYKTLVGKLIDDADFRAALAR